jgi:hypothetical protein
VTGTQWGRQLGVVIAQPPPWKSSWRRWSASPLLLRGAQNPPLLAWGRGIADVGVRRHSWGGGSGEPAPARRRSARGSCWRWKLLWTQGEVQEWWHNQGSECARSSPRRRPWRGSGEHREAEIGAPAQGSGPGVLKGRAGLLRHQENKEGSDRRIGAQDGGRRQTRVGPGADGAGRDTPWREPLGASARAQPRGGVTSGRRDLGRTARPVPDTEGRRVDTLRTRARGRGVCSGATSQWWRDRVRCYSF